MKKHWYDYLWIASILYLLLGFFNILFAWLGMLCFLIPLFISITKGNKNYCNKYCGRGQLFSILGKKHHLSRNQSVPKWIRSKWFRYSFLTFFMAMFVQMVIYTVLVFRNIRPLSQTIKLLWTFKIPWEWAYQISEVPLWISQFAFGFYSMMITSTVLGILTMFLYKPRSWCVYCPMGTITQIICTAKGKKE